MIAEAEQTIPGIVALPTVGAGNETADVHAPAIKVVRDSETCATTARDEEHPYRTPLLAVRFHLFRRSRMRP